MACKILLSSVIDGRDLVEALNNPERADKEGCLLELLPLFRANT